MMKMWNFLLLSALTLSTVSCGTLYFKPHDSEQKVQEEKITEVICPEGRAACPSGNTCCKLSSGEYGCCPLPNLPTKTLNKELDAVVCPGGSSQCPDGTTCCKLATGQYGCCPIPNAVCCSDGVHCCPSGTTCDVSAGKCNRQDGTSVFMSKKISAKPVSVEAVVCPGGSSQCPDGTTCCKLGTGQYGCCPLPNAVCCSDGVHCCPSGTTCDVSAGKCNRQDGTSVFMSKKISAKPVSVEAVVCPGGSSQCPDGTTCCKLGTGQYGCCPLPNAVCCSDGVHCCPSGTTCDVSAGKCNRQDGTSVFMSKKISAKPVSVEAVVCPGGSSQCPDGTTCCKLGTGQYGCCPLPNAVCCSDGVHCCPSGTTCDVSAGKCNRQDGTSVFMSKKISAQSIKKETAVKTINVKYGVMCPDGHSQCPDGNTCCILSGGDYGCCPLPDATCCSDNEHCCPHGMTCDTTKSQCNGNGITVPMVKKSQAKLKISCCGSTCCPDGYVCSENGLCKRVRNPQWMLFKNGF